jgi:hypothetical protein
LNKKKTQPQNSKTRYSLYKNGPVRRKEEGSIQDNNLRTTGANKKTAGPTQSVQLVALFILLAVCSRLSGKASFSHLSHGHRSPVLLTLKVKMQFFQTFTILF